MLTLKNEVRFAQQTLRSYMLYVHLAEHERVEPFRQLLSDMAETAGEQFDFWAHKTGIRGDTVSVPRYTYVLYRLMRRYLGLSYTARVIAGKKERRLREYKRYCTTCTADDDHRRIDVFVLRMQALIERLEALARSSHESKKKG